MYIHLIRISTIENTLKIFMTEDSKETVRKLHDNMYDTETITHECVQFEYSATIFNKVIEYFKKITKTINNNIMRFDTFIEFPDNKTFDFELFKYVNDIQNIVDDISDINKKQMEEQQNEDIQQNEGEINDKKSLIEENIHINIEEQSKENISMKIEDIIFQNEDIQQQNENIQQQIEEQVKDNISMKIEDIQQQNEDIQQNDEVKEISEELSKYLDGLMDELYKNGEEKVLYINFDTYNKIKYMNKHNGYNNKIFIFTTMYMGMNNIDFQGYSYYALFEYNKYHDKDYITNNKNDIYKIYYNNTKIKKYKNGFSDNSSMDLTSIIGYNGDITFASYDIQQEYNEEKEIVIINEEVENTDETTNKKVIALCENMLLGSRKIIIDDEIIIALIEKEYMKEIRIISEYIIPNYDIVKELLNIKIRNEKGELTIDKVENIILKINDFLEDDYNKIKTNNNKKDMMETVRIFTNNYCIRKVGSKIYSSELYDYFTDYLRKNDPQQLIYINRNNFTPIMKQLNFRTKRDKSGIYWVDLEYTNKNETKPCGRLDFNSTRQLQPTRLQTYQTYYNIA